MVIILIINLWSNAFYNFAKLYGSLRRNIRLEVRCLGVLRLLIRALSRNYPFVSMHDP